MGVPRFYRWLAKRYPAFRSTADAGTQPHVDNLYLDLNGIVHQCARHDRGPGVGAAPDHEIFVEVFAQISAIVELVGPHRLVFLGLDGVAPRAKLNQQRARRFVSALEKPARDDYESAPEWFDGNCITPGTAFMHALGDALAFLVQQKMGDDSHWANLDVILSTTAVPGEGEHKIMEYIRQRNDPPSTVHCAYGADADLVLLALASHEPHFLVIREIPDYRGMRSAVEPEARPQRSCAPMEFMSIAVLREYLSRDLCSPAAKDFFDIERAIDDFVLCSFLCGNDFLPHLPAVDIAEGALDAIVLLYRKMLPEWKDYLTLDGEIAMRRFENFLKELSVLEPLVLGLKGASRSGSGEGARHRRRNLTGNEIASKVLRTVNSMWEDRIERDHGTTDTITERRLKRHLPTVNKRPGDWTCSKCAVNNFAHRTNCFKCSAVRLAVQDDGAAPDVKVNDDWAEQSKREYYAQKLRIAPRSAHQRKLCREFLKGMAWTLKYYVTGCPSWGWYYPFHYAPFLSDMVNLSEHCVYEVGFKLGKPYTPLQQLLAVLPPGSAWALPRAYRKLMLDQNSMISDFYPAEFAQDANGKRNDWEATILLDFVDEKRLLAAAATVECQLTQLEAKRNSFAPPLRFRRTLGANARVPSIKSPFPDMFPDGYSRVRCWPDGDTKTSLARPQARWTYKTQLRPGATCTPPPSPSLPVLWHPDSRVTGGLETPGGVYVFGESKSTKNSVVMNLLEPRNELKDSIGAYRSLCGAVISINWPWQQLAVCIGVLTVDDHAGDAQLADLQFELEKDAMLNKYRSERGICLPEPKMLVFARPIRYAAEVHNGRPIYGTDAAVSYPLSCVETVEPNDWRVAERNEPPLQLGEVAVVIDPSSPYFGGMCHQIVSKNMNGKCIARIEARATVSYAEVVARLVDSPGPWLTIDELCEATQLSVHVAQQLVQDLHFRFRKQVYDVGLHFRFFKRGLLRAGFVRRKEHCMHGVLVYSPKAIDYIQAYRKHVPELFEGLESVEAKRAHPTKTKIGKGTAGAPFVAAEIFDQDTAQSILDRCAAFRGSHLSDIWIEPLYHNCSAVLGSLLVKELEHRVDAEQRTQTIEVEIDQTQLLRPGALTDTQHKRLCGNVSSTARATLGSLVCYTMASGPIRFGTICVVVGIHPPNISDETSISWTLDVVIQATPTQKCAIGGSSLGGRCSALRGVSIPASCVVNLGGDSAFPETCPVAEGFTDKETLDAVKQQVEFYLSDKNLPKDSYFGSLVRLQEEGFVAIEKILACNRIKELTKDLSLVAEACRSSSRLVVSTDGKTIRRAQAWVPTRNGNKRQQSENRCDTRFQNENKAATVTPTRAANLAAPELQQSPSQAGALKPIVGRRQLTTPMQVQRATRVKKVPDVSPLATSGAVVAVAATVAAARVPAQLRRHTVLALSIWPTCLLVGHAVAQGTRPTHSGIMRQGQPASTRDLTSNAVLATIVAVASGIAVVGCRCAEAMDTLYHEPSMDTAIHLMRNAGRKLYEDRWAVTTATTLPELPPLLTHNPRAVVVALSFVPFGYVCGSLYRLKQGGN